MKRLLLVFTIALIAVSCEKEEVSPELYNTESSLPDGCYYDQHGRMWCSGGRRKG